MRYALERPELYIAPPDEWPDPLPRARVNVSSDDEWDRITDELLGRGILEAIDFEDIAEIRPGQRVLNGAFGVPKSGPAPDGHDVALRFIANLTPSNSGQYIIAGDLHAPPLPGEYGHVVLADDEVLALSGEDISGCFHLYELPVAWRRWFAFEKPRTDGKYVTVRVIPMGWLSAVGVVQHMHRRVAGDAFRTSARLPSANEYA